MIDNAGPIVKYEARNTTAKAMNPKTTSKKVGSPDLKIKLSYSMI